MNEFKGTKGKWEYSGGDNSSIDIVLPNDTTISIDRYNRYGYGLVGQRQEMEANAKLISKAPQMLEMLISISETAYKIWKINDENEFFDEVDFAELDDLIKEATEI